MKCRAAAAETTAVKPATAETTAATAAETTATSTATKTTAAAAAVLNFGRQSIGCVFC